MTGEYASVAAVAPYFTCYLTYDQLGSVRMVTDQNGAVVGRHDYVPYGEEVPGGSYGRTAALGFGSNDGVRQRFTGQARDSENTPALDYFNARYMSAVMGRFGSVDPGNAGADVMNPQSWNGYGYVLGNPLGFVDPSGMCAYSGSGDINDPNNYNDDDGVQTCAEAFGAPTPISTTTTAQSPSDLEYLFTISTNEIPIYVQNDVQLNPTAQKVVTQLGKMLPTVCGGGAFIYLGAEGKGQSWISGPSKAGNAPASHSGPSGFVGGILEFDSRSGISGGTIREVGGGEDFVAGYGQLTMTNSSGATTSSSLVYGGVGAEVNGTGASATLIGYSNGVGFGIEAMGGGAGGGVGGYINIVPNSSCISGHR